MNAAQAKQIPLTDIMDRLGYVVMHIRRNRTEYQYISPFRDEQEPSFYVNVVKNAFYDHGDVKGGNSLDFAIRYLEAHGKASSVSDALKWIEQMMGASHRIQHSPPPPKREQAPVVRELQYVTDLPLTSRVILKYLKEKRGIPAILAKKYLRLVKYTNLKRPRKDNEPYFAFGIPNNSGGWEIRSASDSSVFKSALKKRDMSYFSGEDSSHHTVDVFEGMLDALSYLVLFGEKAFPYDCIILNGLGSYAKANRFITKKGYRTIRIWLDNHAPADVWTEQFKIDFPDKVVSFTHLFGEHKDLNEVLVAKNMTELRRKLVVFSKRQ